MAVGPADHSRCRATAAELIDAALPRLAQLADLEGVLGQPEMLEREGSALVDISEVSTLSLITTGIPCKGPRGPDLARSASRAAASSRAAGLTLISEFRAGPASS